MEPASLLAAARRRWWVIVLLAVLGGAVGAIPSSSRSVDATTTYNASHTLLVSNSASDQTIFSDPVSLNQLQLFATTGEVPRRVAESIDFAGVPAALATQISVVIEASSGALRISTQQRDPIQASLIADTFADELAAYIAERQDELKASREGAALARIEALEAEISELEPRALANPDDTIVAAQLAALESQYQVEFGSYRQLQEDDGQLTLTTLERAQPVAITESGLSAPTSRTGRGILAGLVGSIAGLGVAVLWAKADKRIRTRDQAEAIVGVRSQVSIPPDNGEAAASVVVAPGRHDSLSDAYRTLRSVVGFVETSLPTFGTRAPVILVLSSGPADGKTSVSANLAAAFAESNRSTVAVNTDFRRPALAERILGRKLPAPGFFAEDIPDLPLTMVVNRTSMERLQVFDVAGAIGSPGDLARVTARMLPQLAAEFEVVVVDSSPVGATAEVLEIVPRVDIVVMVVRLDHTYAQSASRTVEIVRSLTQVPILLTVVGEAPDRYDYSYEYGHHRPKKQPKQRRPAKSRV